MVTLALGPLVFTGFELPEQINFGGKHAHLTHKLPGGERVIDAMGRDDDDITWQGRFRGAQAPFRARRVDALRVSGQPVTLAWGGFRHTVVVTEFRAEYRQAFEIPYTVTCLVVTPPPSAAAPRGLLDLLSTDLSAALNLGIAGASDALASVQSAVATARSLKDGLRGGLPGIAASIASAQSLIGDATGAADALLTTAGLPATSATDFAGGLLAQADALADLDALHTAAANLGRMAANLRAL